ncbi:hypothetical protein RXV95_00505 [Novosphingobium sp. ZN18A2]|uniref:hypothetical protein n=1 Tax=Novosphingobium sp. ZN18A2 TaxID=3079861 RepID=UPI0030D15235
MTDTSGGPSADDRRARIEATLAAYPHVDSEALEELLTWYRQEASSYDVAMLASNERLAAGYRLFRKQRIDPIGWRDAVTMLAFVALVVAGIVAMLMRQG